MVPATLTAGVPLQDRDIDILRSLFESRVMTALHFGGRSEAAKKRLQRLRAAGVLQERPRRHYDPAILFLTARGFQVLIAQGVLRDYPPVSKAALQKRAQVSDLTLRHELEVMTVKAALSPAINSRPGFHVSEFSTWPLLFQFLTRRPAGQQARGSADLLIKPDGYIRIHEDSGGGAFEHTFFLEVDRSTEAQGRLGMRAACYLDFYKSGRLAERHGQPAASFKDFPFRVLMVFKNAERRNNTAERILQGHPPVLTQVWLTTLDEVSKDPLGAVWIRPVDYRAVTSGTGFDPERRREIKIYRRQPEREELVEEKIARHRLLD